MIAEPTDAAIDDAAERLRRGDVVAFPTETVYGLGADTFDERAVWRVFALKGRPADNPLIAHVPDVAAVGRVTDAWDERCARLAARFWPGPLTLVLPKRDDVPRLATGGRDTIAVRRPRHPVAAALLERFGGPVSAPSANRSGHVSPTTARHVADDFADVGDLLILDGGRCDVGLESTVLDCTVDPVRILRPGGVTAAELRGVLGDVDDRAVRGQAASPGTAPRHYAPRRPATILAGDAIEADLARAAGRAAVLCFDAAVVPPPHRAFVMPQGAADYARALYETLRAADASGCDRIVIERPPTGNDVWRAVHDRLSRMTDGDEGTEGRRH